MRTSKSRNKHVAKISCNKVNFLGDACATGYWFYLRFVMSPVPLCTSCKMKEYAIFV